MPRPTKYDPKLADKMLKFFDRPIRDKRGKLNKLPTFAGFALSIGLHRETLLEWSKDEEKPEFSDAYKRAKDYQEEWLVQAGLGGHVETAFGIFTAKNVLGWRDRQKDEAEVVINNYSNLTEEQLDARLAALEAKRKAAEEKK